MPPCGWPFTTLTVFAAGGAAVDGAPAAELPGLEAPDGAVEPPSSPPGRRSTNARMRTTTVAARMPMRGGAVTGGRLRDRVPGRAPSHAWPAPAAPRGAPRRPGPGRSLLRTGARGMRFARILVPLDGSPLAEAVMPVACSLAKRLGGTLLLLHVLEHEPPAAVHGEPHLCDAREALAYLERRATELRREGIAVESHVHERPVEDVAPAVDVHAHEFDADLIAMCAHGRSNLRTRLIGSIAERILRAGSVPVLLRTVRRADQPAFALRRVLVPIDFGHDIDAALDAARLLAPPYGAAVTLLAAPERPAPVTSRLLPGASALMRAYDLDALRGRIGEVADRLRADLPDVEAMVAEQPPTPAILAASDGLPADLIVLVTDAHGGLSSWSEPSTVQQLLRRADLTLLLIREL